MACGIRNRTIAALDVLLANVATIASAAERK
jgi:hypothetical protein